MLASGKQNPSMGPVTKEVREAGPRLTIAIKYDIIPLGTKQAHGRWLESGIPKVPLRAVLTLPFGQRAPVSWPGHWCDGRVYWSGGRASLSSCWEVHQVLKTSRWVVLLLIVMNLGSEWQLARFLTPGDPAHEWESNPSLPPLLLPGQPCWLSPFALPLCFLGEFIKHIPFWVSFN